MSSRIPVSLLVGWGYAMSSNYSILQTFVYSYCTLFVNKPKVWQWNGNQSLVSSTILSEKSSTGLDQVWGTFVFTSCSDVHTPFLLFLNLFRVHVWDMVVLTFTDSIHLFVMSPGTGAYCNEKKLTVNPNTKLSRLFDLQFFNTFSLLYTHSSLSRIIIRDSRCSHPRPNYHQILNTSCIYQPFWPDET